MDDRALMALHADIGYRHDGAGRMLETNELNALPAPQVWIGITGGVVQARFGAGVSEAGARRLAALATSAADPADRTRRELESQLPGMSERSGPVFEVSTAVESAAVEISEANLHLARRTFPWLEGELAHCRPTFGMVVDGAVVAVCFSARVGASAVEAGVETLPEFRRRGYGRAAAAAWGSHARQCGLTAFYSTTWDNRGSLAIARGLGWRSIGSEVSWK